jgi:hypothetical protein
MEAEDLGFTQDAEAEDMEAGSPESGRLTPSHGDLAHGDLAPANDDLDLEEDRSEPPSAVGALSSKSSELEDAVDGGTDVYSEHAEETAVRYSSAFVAPAAASEPPGYATYESVPPASSPNRRTDSVAPSPHAEGSSDNMLSRYFREMASHQVMGPDEELQAAQAVEQAEVEMWVSLLAYLPVAEHIPTCR